MFPVKVVFRPINVLYCEKLTLLVNPEFYVRAPVSNTEDAANLGSNDRLLSPCAFSHARQTSFLGHRLVQAAPPQTAQWSLSPHMNPLSPPVDLSTAATL